jgi:hypothetical protein
MANSPGSVNAIAPGHTETDLARCKFERQSLCQCFDGAFRGSVQQLQKVHSQGPRSLPAKDGSWRELDASLSSDALLMNIFCYPGVTRRREVCRILGLEPGSVPDFGFMPRVPLLSEATERTEVDMKLGNMLFEAKLTEGDFRFSVWSWSRDIGILGTYLSVDSFPGSGGNTFRIGSYAMCSRLMRSIWTSVP